MSDISVIAYCREMIQFDLPSAMLKKRAEKFDSALLNWHYIELLDKILCIFLVYRFFLYYVRFYLRVNKDEYKERFRRLATNFCTDQTVECNATE